MANNDNKEIITRAQAIELRINRYFTGIKCRRGHLSKRNCINFVCVECQAENDKGKKKSPERLKLKNDRYRKRYPEKIKEHKRKYKEKNADKVRIQARATKHQRRARKKSVGGTHTGKQILNLVQKQKNKCTNCLCIFPKTKYHIDHIMPLAKGGSNDIKNIQLLCPTCNIRKSDIDPFAFARMNGRLL